MTNWAKKVTTFQDVPYGGSFRFANLKGRSAVYMKTDFRDFRNMETGDFGIVDRVDSEVERIFD